MSCCYGKVRLSSKVASLAKTTFLALVHAAKTGEVVASVEVIDRRLSVCVSCSRNVGGVCQACGCPVHRKAVPVVSVCPDGRW